MRARHCVKGSGTRRTSYTSAMDKKARVTDLEAKLYTFQYILVLYSSKILNRFTYKHSVMVSYRINQ